MNETKHWLASRTMWGGIMAFIGGVLHSTGYVLDDPAWYADTIVQLVAALLEVIGAVVVMYGRIKATKRIDGTSVFPLLMMTLVCTLALTSGGCKATAAEQLNIRQHAINAKAISQKFDAIETPTAQDWIDAKDWIRGQAETLKQIYRGAGGDVSNDPAFNEPTDTTGATDDAARTDDDDANNGRRQALQIDRRPAGLPAADGHKLRGCAAQDARAGVLCVCGPDHGRIDRRGGDHAGRVVNNQRPGRAEGTTQRDDAAPGGRPCASAIDRSRCIASRVHSGDQDCA